MEKESKIQELQQQINLLESKLNDSVKPLEQLKVLHEWVAPEREFIRRDKSWFLKVALIFVFGMLIFAFMGDILAILVAITLLLLIYALTTNEPPSVVHQVTTKGVKTLGRTYKWAELKDYFIVDKSGRKILNLRTRLGFPGRIVLLFSSNTDLLIVSEILGRYLEQSENN